MGETMETERDPAILRDIEEQRLCDCGAAGSSEEHEGWCNYVRRSITWNRRTERTEG